MNLKKFLAGVLACCVIGGALPSGVMSADNAVITASAADVTSGKYESLEYINFGDYIKITDCDPMATSVVIPAEIEGVPVTSISEDAFWHCTNLTEITIPDSVTSIGNYAFRDCSGLTSITIPNSVTSIGCGAFESCKGLTEITFPDSVTSIGSSAFQFCSNLTEITFSDSITNIGFGAFDSTAWFKARRAESPFVVANGILIDGKACSGDVVIPDSVTSISEYAFYWCKAITSITIPGSVTSIGSCAFGDCSNLTEITISDGVKSIDSSAFNNCESLTEITIPNSVTSIDPSAFGACKRLTAINVPDSNNNYSDIDGVLFNKDKTKLVSYPYGKSETYTIPNSVTSIGEGSFSYCRGLTEITIPDSVTSIGENAFYKCESLTEVTIPDSVTSIGERAFWCCKGLTSITLPDSLTSTGDLTFAHCEGLTEVTISDGVTSIGYGEFYNCTGLTEITILNPSCEIYNEKGTISDTATIYGYENSTAQAYAEKYNREFVSLGEAPETIMGDVNNDGSLDISDVVLLQKWILAVPDTHLDNWKAADLCEDGKLDAFDLSLMKRKLING